MKVILDIDQQSNAWWHIRRGIPTASNFARIITPAKGEYATTAAGTYMDELIAGVLDPQPKFTGSSDTNRGNQLESPALRWLAFEHGIQTERVGFVLSDCETFGCSPDAFVLGTTVPVEVKAPDIHTFIGWKREIKKTGQMPREHKAQVHGEMFVCESDHAYFVAYAEHPAIDRLMMRVERDEFTDKIGPYLKRFNEELRELEEDVLGKNLNEYRDGLAKMRRAAMTHPLTPAA
jgi:hypothetical protein